MMYLRVDYAFISVEHDGEEFSIHMPPVRGPSIASLLEQLRQQRWSCDGPFLIVEPLRIQA